MYTFGLEEDRQAFISFVEARNGSFMQLPMWAAVKSNWTPLLFSGRRDGALVLTCLVLTRKIPVSGTLWYIPNGFVCDYADERLVEQFTSFLKGEMRSRGAFACVIDPDIPLRIDGAVQPAAEKTAALLARCGFQPNPDRNNYTYQPSLTAMLELSETDAAETLLKQCDKGVRYSVRVGPERGLRSEAFSYAELRENEWAFEKFLDVMGDTTERLEVVRRPREYYLSFMEQFAPWAVLDLIYYDKRADSAAAEKKRTQLAELEELRRTETRANVLKKYAHEKQTLEGQLESFRQRSEEARAYTDADRLYLAAGITICFGEMTSCVFGGTKNVLRNTLRASHYLNYVRICRSIKEGRRLHDMGRVPHSYMSPDAPEHGLFLFKMSFHAHLYEFMGEYTLVSRRAAYQFYHKLMPLVRNNRMKVTRFFKKLLGRA